MSSGLRVCRTGRGDGSDMAILNLRFWLGIKVEVKIS